MHSFIPYLVILGVIVAFFLICYFVFREPAQKSSSLSEEHRADRRRKVREYAKGTGTAADLVSSEPTKASADDSQKLKTVETQAVKADSASASTAATKETDAEQQGEGLQTSPVADGYGSVSIHEGTPEAMTMVLSPVDGPVKEEPALDAAEVTQPLAGLSTMAGNEDAT
ncbi:MAG: hypothetical protein HUJ85_01545, partial [Veillonella sp.]|nr:hypothetical protein [Veillonella sp.]